MTTNGANGKKTPSERSKKRATPKATAAQVRAMREYLKIAGHKFDPKRLAKIRSQWVD